MTFKKLAYLFNHSNALQLASIALYVIIMLALGLNPLWFLANSTMWAQG